MTAEQLKHEGDYRRQSLRKLYSHSFAHEAWRDSGDVAYIGTTLIERSIALCAPQMGGDLLDVGSGADPYRSYFRNVRRKVNCDYSDSRGPIAFVSSAGHLPVHGEAFDSILCTEVLEHVPDPVAVWKEFYRVLRPGGRVLLSTPMYWPPHELPYDFYRYPEHGLRWMATSNGFEIETLIPRGGVWALWGQVTLHVMHHYFPLKIQRRLWNGTLLKLDAWRCNPQITLGWTILARKP